MFTGNPLRSDPLVSVIVPAYNAQRTIEAAVASALGQTHANVEVIVINDGSTDATASVVDAIAARDGRLRQIIQSNRGVSASRNRGIDAAKGDWIALLDADDRFRVDRVARLLALTRIRPTDMLADNLAVSSDIYSGAPNFIAFPRDRVLLEGTVDAATFVRFDRPKWGLRSAGFIKPLIRRAFLDDSGVRYPENISAGEDFYFYVTCLTHGAKLQFVPDALYEYTLQSVSLSHGDDDRVIAQYVTASRELKGVARLRNLQRLVTELDRRETEMINWLAFFAVTDQLKDRRYLATCRALLRLPSPIDGVLRLAERMRDKVAARLGLHGRNPLTT